MAFDKEAYMREYAKKYKKTPTGRAVYHKARQKWVESKGGEGRYLRDHYIKATYGMSPEGFEGWLKMQEGKCAICGIPHLEQAGGRLCVDHDAVTGEIRGLLCSQCNAALGLFKHDPGLLRLAAGYLTEEDPATPEGS